MEITDVIQSRSCFGVAGVSFGSDITTLPMSIGGQSHSAFFTFDSYFDGIGFVIGKKSAELKGILGQAFGERFGRNIGEPGIEIRVRDFAAVVSGGCRLASLQLAAALPATSSTKFRGGRRFLLSVSCRELQACSLRSQIFANSTGALKLEGIR